MESALAKDPDNADLNAQLAERYLLLGDQKQAKALSDKALAKRPNHPVGTYVQARLLGPQLRVRVALGKNGSVVAGNPYGNNRNVILTAVHRLKPSRSAKSHPGSIR